MNLQETILRVLREETKNKNVSETQVVQNIIQNIKKGAQKAAQKAAQGIKQDFDPPQGKVVEDFDVILMGGLDYRKGDLNISQQVELLKKNSSKKKIIGHRYNQFSDVKNSIAQNPNAIIVLFSAGCSYASTIASLIKNKSKLFIVEPYAISSNTTSSVQNAVGKGVPATNVITGPSKARGLDVVSGATKTPKGLSHWDALGYVGKLI